MRISKLASITLLVALLGSVAWAAEEEFDWKGSMAVGQTVEIKGINGGITARPSSGGDVEVHAVKRGDDDDPTEVKIEVVEHADGVTICAVYPSGRGRANVCKPGKGGHLGANDNDVSVDFTVSVPAGVDLVGTTVNGSVKADDLDGNVIATTVNGRIDASATGHVLATTVNGAIRASMGRVDWDGDMDVRSVNGSITLELPADADADVRVKTLNGEIRSEFEIEVDGKLVGKIGRGTLGSGGRRLEIESVNGSITLNRR